MNIKNKMLAVSLVAMSLVGSISIANAAVPTDEEVSQAQSGQKDPSAPDAYYQYGMGQVKADGQWVNDGNSN